MPSLVRPSTEFRRSYVVAAAETAAEGGVLRWREEDLTEAGFGRFVDAILDEANEATPRPAGRVPATTLWWTEADEYLGRIGIRHRLTGDLCTIGGHIGYDVRPTARRRGHATAMLREALPIARTLGVDRALITCDEDNVGSRRVIEANGGVFENAIGNKLRFWVTTR